MRATLALLSCCIALPVMAQETAPAKCGVTEVLRKELAKNWREVETTVGLMDGGQAYISIFVSPLGETWTAIIGRIDGTSCIVATGHGWFQGEVPTGDPA